MIDINLNLAPKQFKVIQDLIYTHAGIALSENKQTMVQGRLAKRLRALKLNTFEQYVDMLQSKLSNDELMEFINCLTTNKTDFFRENHHFKYLTEQILPSLMPSLEIGASSLRIWSAACSTGEEPYSLAIALKEALSENVDARILASDIDTEVLEKGAQGIYAADRVAEIPKYLLHRYFDKLRKDPKSDSEVMWQAKPDLKKLIRFHRINFQDPTWPIQGKFDAILCRNVMIYFDQDTKRRLVERFSNVLKPGGHLFIGHSETLSGISEKFELVGNTVYRLREDEDDIRCPVAVASESNFETNYSPTATTSRTATRSESQRKGLLRSVPLKLNLPTETRAKPYTLARSKETVHPIIVGEIHATYEPMWISTLLGSCVSACLYDERMKIGGMNHFMLPLGSAEAVCASYGVHAMEMLINSLMKLGADRRRMKAKLFGGGAVIRTSDSRWNVGNKNVEFAKSFLEAEKIPLVASHTGGMHAMHIRFHTSSAKAIVRVLDERLASKVMEAEKRQPTSVETQNDSVTLF